MNKFRLLSPYLYAIYPLLWAYAANINELQFFMLIRPLIIIIGLTTIILMINKYLLKDWDRVNVISSLIMVMILGYGYYQEFPNNLRILGISFNRHILIITLWVLGFAIINSNTIWKRIRPNVVSSYIAVLGLILLILPLYSMVVVCYRYYNDPLTAWQPSDIAIQNPIKPTGEYTPNIFYIILDGYARSDILKDIYDFDNSGIINFLQEHGFYLANASQSNYTQTALSLASSLNFDYLDMLPQESGKSHSKIPLQKLIQNNSVRSYIHTAGYRFISSISIYDWSEIKDADEYIYSSNNPFNELEMYLWESSFVKAPIEIFDLSITFSGYELHRNIITQNLYYLPEVAKQDGPNFIFAHILAPHPPFIFDRYGNAINKYKGFTLSDGSHYYGSQDEYREGYVEQLIYLNKMLIQTIEKILRNSTNPPIIILQADHGPGMLLDQESKDNSCLIERTSILNAYFLPGEQKYNLYASITPVNTFRIILDTYFNTNLGLLEDQVYYSAWSQPYLFIDISQESKYPCNNK